MSKAFEAVFAGGASGGKWATTSFRIRRKAEAVQGSPGQLSPIKAENFFLRTAKWAFHISDTYE